MTNAQHTPGPWIAEEENIYGNLGGKHQLLARVFWECVRGNAAQAQPHSLTEAIANVSLIAAAPELLDFVERFLKAEPSVRAISKLVDEAANLVLKARGEA